MNQRHNDQYYIDKIIEGDTNAFSVVVERYKHMVYTLALRLVKNKEEAEEVAQDTFIKVYGNLEKFKGDSKFSSWIYRIAYNRSLDVLKKQKNRVDTTPIDVGTEYYIPSISSVLDDLERKDRMVILKSAIQELNGDDSVLITLHYFEELSLGEISEIMEKETNVLKVRLFRARKKLAEILRTKLTPETVEKYEQRR
ncbi:RNA polymerase sigma factor [Spongiimicrobium salis]|uniref:RNA polymerase sigma factor n=1 Tax=Spongiimicrobium salis TaxID=1667022 RepID=UPI00374D3D18